MRQDKATSKLRIVVDASARSTGPSLKDCLYTGPKSGQSIFDILLRFRLHRVGLTGDIEKAFHMVSVHEADRDSLRFLWATNPGAEQPELVTLRFTRVVFEVSSSPFLLNATIGHHMGTYRKADASFMEHFLSSIYVDDVISGSENVAFSYQFFLKSNFRLAIAGFWLQDFITNSRRLQYLVQKDEQEATRDAVDGETQMPTHAEEDQSYAKSSLGTNVEIHRPLPDPGCSAPGSVAQRKSKESRSASCTAVGL